MIPDTWEEMNSAQLLAVCRTINGEIDNYTLFLSDYSGISRKMIEKLSPYALYQLAGKTAFVTNKNNMCALFIIQKIKGTRYVAPEPKLERMTFGQFIFAESYYRDWIREQKNEQLFSFIAALYLKRKEKFKYEMIPSRAKRFKSGDIEIFKAIAFNYSMVMNWLEKRYPMIFRERSDGDTIESESKVERSVWIKCFNSLVGDDLINRDQYARLPVHVVLRYMTGKYLENINR